MTRAGRALAGAIGLATVVGLARAAVDVPHGLSADYFTNVERSGPPSFSVLDKNASTDEIVRQWRGSPPASFSVRWHGYLAVGRPGDYRFATASDDDSWLYIDGRLVVDNSGTHGIALQ